MMRRCAYPGCHIIGIKYSSEAGGYLCDKHCRPHIKRELARVSGYPRTTEQVRMESIEDLQSSPKRIISSIRGLDPTKSPTSQTILSQAQEIIAGRHERYGDCTEVFAATNEMFAIYRGLKKGETSAHDTAVFNIIQKLVRIGSGQNHQDNWIDIAGYAATGGEVSNDG